MRLSSLCLCSLFLCSAVPSHLQESSKPNEGQWALVRPGFLTVENYLGLEPRIQAVYIAGLVDGMYLAPVFDAPNDGKYLGGLRNCVKDGGMTNTQLAAIVTKHARNRPEEWQYGANLVAYQALRKFVP